MESVGAMTWDNFWDWIAYGVEQGWCSQPVCGQHDTVPFSDAEYEEMELGWDICFSVTRLYGAEHEQG